MTSAANAVAPLTPFTAERLSLEVDRAIQRSLKGMEYLGSPAPEVGASPKTQIHRRGTLSLYHYQPKTQEVYRVSLLLVMATTHRGYIFDLAPGQSLIEFLLLRGYDVYVMDWNPPSASEAGLRFEDYVLDFLPDCIARVQAHSGESQVTLAGYCMGGVLASIYAALHPQGPVKNLVCFTTPIDWKHMTLYQSLSDRQHFDVDRLVGTLGIVPSEVVLRAFEAPRPVSRLAAQIRLWDNMWNDQYVLGYRKMDRWGAETLPVAGEYLRQTVKELVWNNALAKSTLRLKGKRVDLGRIRVPLLHVIAQYDHLVPPECARPLVAMAGSTDKEEIMLPGGHVSLVGGANALKRMWPPLPQWLGKRST